MAEDYAVRGHLCAGLRAFQRTSGANPEVSVCVPKITAQGYIEACDAKHAMPLWFCPFCAAPFGPLSGVETR